MTPRNLILIILLSAFLLWYVGNWAYTTQYLDPRNELTADINTLSQQIEWGEDNLAARRHFNKQNFWWYHRSLPSTPNDVRQYSFWLLEVLQYYGFENNRVEDFAPTRFPPIGADCRFQVRCTGSLEQLSYFLAEFYTAPFLHRITSMTLTPTEGSEEILDFSITINALAMDARFNPFRDANNQVSNQLPTGWFPRLMFNDLAFYQVIADRNLLRTARGGIDRADFTHLSALHLINGQKEAWFRVLTDPDGTPPTRARLGDTIRFGSFEGRIVEIHDLDIVIDRGGERWLLSVSGNNNRLSDAFALPPETAEVIE